MPESLTTMAGALPSCVGNSLGESPFCVGGLLTEGCGAVNPLPGGAATQAMRQRTFEAAPVMLREEW